MKKLIIPPTDYEVHSNEMSEKPNGRKNIYIYLLLTGLFLFVFAFSSSAQETGFIKVKNYSPQEYKAHSQNWGVAQNKDGILYFGNTNGILEYDGTSWKTIKFPNNSSCISITSDKNGRIYAGGSSEFGFLQPDASGKTKYVSLIKRIQNKSLVFSDIWQTHCAENQAYFLSQKYLFKYDGKKNVTVFNASSSFTNGFAIKDRFFVYESGVGLKEVVGDSLVSVPFGKAFYRTPGWTAFPISAEKILFGSFNDGLFIIDLITETAVPFAIDDEKFIRERTINCGIRLRDGNYAFGVSDGGVIIIGKDGSTIRRLNVNSGLQNEVIWSLFQDREDNLWIATNSGISKASVNSDIEFWNNTYGRISSIEAVLRFDSKIYAASFSGLYSLKNNSFEKFPEFNRECFSLLNFKTPDEPDFNSLMVGGNTSIIYEVKENNLKEAIKLPENVRELYQSRYNPNRIYVPSFDSLYSIIRKNKSWVYEGRIKGIDELTISISEDRNGDIWLGTQVNGALRLRKSDNHLKPQIKRYTVNDGLPVNSDLMFFFEKDHLIVGTDSGLYKFDEKHDRFVKDDTFGKEFCDGSTAIANIYSDKSGKTWLTGYRNEKELLLVLIPDGKGKYTKFEEPFLSVPGIIPENFYVEDNGVSWFGATFGLFKYKGDFKNKKYPFKPLIREIIFNDERNSIIPSNLSVSDNDKSKVLKLNYSQNTFTINFSASSFLDEFSNEFQTYMEGLEEHWTNWNTDRKREFINLDEGKYRFCVKARNLYNQESDIVVFAFEITPPWYRTIAAYIVYAVMAILLIYLIIYLNVRRIKAANIKLQKLIDKRTLEVVEQNRLLELQKLEISEKKDAIEAQADSLRKMNDKLIELDKFKEGLTGMIVHDLKNPLNTILGLSKEQETLQAGKQMLNMVLNILDVQKFENVQMTLNLSECRLSELVRESVEQVKFLLERKSITFRNITITEYKVKVDFELIVRVLVNLLTNAIKYSSDNSAIIFSAEKMNDFLCLSVKDSGEGIPEDKIDSIFEKFTQLEERKSGRIRSTGIGLTFCKLAVEAHGGKIWVSSVQGEGSNFKFTIPVSEVLFAEYTPKSDIEMNTENMVSSLNFSDIEKELIIPYINRLKNYSVYEYSDIISVIEEMDFKQSESVDKWKKQLIITVKSCNEDKYIELINLF